MSDEEDQVQRGDDLQLAQEVCGLIASEMERPRQLEGENARLKRPVADLSLDRPVLSCAEGAMLQDVVSRKL